MSISVYILEIKNIFELVTKRRHRNFLFKRIVKYLNLYIIMKIIYIYYNMEHNLIRYDPWNTNNNIFNILDESKKYIFLDHKIKKAIDFILNFL